MRIDGRCHRASITDTAEIDPAEVYVCHCTDGQTLSGTAFRTAASCRRADFRLLTGKPSIYVKTAESGSRRIQTFCPACGTPIYATDADVADADFSLRLGAVAQRHALKPRLQLWCRSAEPWLEGLAAIPRREREEGF
jgi:hypothetical protein